MRDMPFSKMAELKFEAPLAQFEETDEWGSTEFKNVMNDNYKINKLNNDIYNELENGFEETNSNNNDVQSVLDNINELNQKNCENGGVTNSDTFTETFSGSLEDLVNTFDEKITKCFGNYEESVEHLAPVQIRDQNDIMNECQIWWTITGNFGSILPIDWSKSCTRKMQLQALGLSEPKENDSSSPDDELLTLSSEDEAVAADLDMHSMVLNGLHHEILEPIKTADEVIREIDDILQEDDEEESVMCHLSEKGKQMLKTPLYEEKLKCLNKTQLNELSLELEILIRDFSETLLAELAVRDELEYEKELKNTFIQLLLDVQNKRRQYHIEKKKSSKNNNSITKPTGLEPKYLTTVIPYNLENGTPDNQALHVLIKILKAINEDSPTVPKLLTDYILKVLCPT